MGDLIGNKNKVLRLLTRKIDLYLFFYPCRCYRRGKILLYFAFFYIYFEFLSSSLSLWLKLMSILDARVIRSVFYNLL